MDYAKTQFLEEDHITHKTLKAFRRKSALMLTQRGKPVHLITWENWSKLRADWPDQVKADGLAVKTVWTLVPVALD